MDSIIRAARFSSQARQLARLARPDVAMPDIPAPSPSPDVQAQAAQILLAARAEAQQLAGGIYEDAEQRGYAQGLLDGAAAGRAAFDAQAARLGTIIAAVADARTAVLAEAEDAMIDLAFGALCAMLGEQAATRDAVARLVRQHGAARAGREQVTVRLHPDDLALLLAADDAQACAAYCLPDPSIALGGCLVESGTGTLDARLETQLERLRATLLAVRAARMQAAP